MTVIAVIPDFTTPQTTGDLWKGETLKITVFFLDATTNRSLGRKNWSVDKGSVDKGLRVPPDKNSQVKFFLSAYIKKKIMNPAMRNKGTSKVLTALQVDTLKKS